MSDNVSKYDGSVGKMIDSYYEALEGNEAVNEYHERHGTESLGILTVLDDERADLIASHLQARIQDKVVVEIGGGIGLLACHLAQYAKQVICFEVDPGWMSCFVHVLYRHKPKNLTYIFGAAQEFACFRADVALFCTHSGHDAMRKVGGMFASEVIDVYAELVGATDVVRNFAPVTAAGR